MNAVSPENYALYMMTASIPLAMLMDLQERENVNLSLYEQQLRDVERNIITSNHKDGVKTITLEDIETALAEAGFGFG